VINKALITRGMPSVEGANASLINRRYVGTAERDVPSGTNGSLISGWVMN
jgi:hypothetical protein